MVFHGSKEESGAKNEKCTCFIHKLVYIYIRLCCATQQVLVLTYIGTAEQYTGRDIILEGSTGAQRPFHFCTATSMQMRRTCVS